MANKTFSFDEAFTPETSLDSTAKTFSYEDAFIPVQKETPPVESLATPKTFSFEEASKPVPTPVDKPVERSLLRETADIPLKASAGVVSGVRMISDVFGANNPVSRNLRSVEDYVAQLYSAQSKADSQEIAAIMKDAEDKGIGEQVRAGLKAFSVAPVDFLASAAGTAVPTVLGGLGASALKLGTMGVRATQLGLGATQGAGVTKGAIYDSVKEELSKTEMPEDQVEARAQLAQSYGGENLDQILLGAAISGLAGTTGVEPKIVSSITKKILGDVSAAGSKSILRETAKAAAKEAIPEVLQGGQEQLAQNLALQREGFDVPTMRGVVGQGTLEGLAGAGLGGGIGAYSQARDNNTARALEAAEETSKTEKVPESREAYIKRLKEEVRSKAQSIKDEAAKAAAPVDTAIAETTPVDTAIAETTPVETEVAPVQVSEIVDEVPSTPSVLDEATQEDMTVDEVPSTPGVLDEATLTSLGLNKRSNAFKELIGVDLNTNEGLAFFEETLDNHTGKINETAVGDYIRSIAPIVETINEPIEATPIETTGDRASVSTLDEQRSEIPAERAVEADRGTVDVAGVDVGQPARGTEPVAAPLETLQVGDTTTIGTQTYRKTDTGFELVAPVEEAAAPEAIEAIQPVDEVQEVDPLKQAKALSSELRSLDPTDPLIEDLLAYDVDEDTIAEARATVAQLVQERQAKGQTQPSELRELSDDLTAAEGEPVEQAAELEVDSDKYLDNTKAELGDVIRRAFPVTENIVPEERASISDLLKAITNLMHAFIRKGVKSMGQAIKQARGLMGQHANKVTPKQYRQAYSEAAERPTKSSAKETATSKKGNIKQEVDKLQKKSGIKKPSNNAGKSLFKSVMEADLNHAIDNLSSAVLSSDNGLNNQMRAELEKSGMSWPAIQKILEGLMTSQATHSQNVAAMFLEMGKIVYNSVANMFEVSDNPAGSYSAMMETIGELAKQYNMSEDAMNLAAHTYFVSNRSRGLINTNNRLKKKALALEVAGKRKEADKLLDKVVQVNMTAAEIKAGLDIRKEIPEIGKIVEQWNVVRLEVINHLVSTGLYSQEIAAELADTFDYVPFYREAQIEANEGPKENTRGLLDRAREKNIKGSYNPVNNVFDNINRWVTYSIARGINNSQALYAVDAMQQNMVGSISPKPLPPTTKVPPGNLVAVWDNGVEKRYRVEDPMFVHYFTGARAAYAPLINTPLVTGVNKVFRAEIVLDPVFSASQVVMDGLTGMFTSGVKHFYMIPIRAIKEFVLTIPNWSKTHKTLRGYGAVGETDFASVSRRISEESKKDGARDYNAVEKIAETLLKPLRWITTASDNAIRQAVYEQEMAESGNQSTAVRKAFEIINFRRAGYSSLVNTTRQSVNFTGAYLQYINVTAKVLTGKGITPTQKKQTLVRLINSLAGFGVISFLTFMAVSDDDEYKKVDQTTLDLRIYLPGLTEKFGVWLPVRADPFMLIAKMIPEHIYNLSRKEGGEDWTKFKKAFKAYMAAAMLGPTPIPQFPKVVLETTMNKSMNTGRDIVGAGIEGRETERQFTSTTSEFSKMLGSSGLVSPVIADYWINNLGASVGRAFIMLTNALMKDSEAPEKSTRDTLASFAPKFIKREGGTRAKNDLYELRDIVDEAYLTYKDIQKYGSEAEYNKKYKETIDKVMEKPGIDVVINQLAQIRSEERMIREYPPAGYTKEFKEAYLKELRDREQTILFDIQLKRNLSGLDKDNPFRKSK